MHTHTCTCTHTHNTHTLTHRHMHIIYMHTHTHTHTHVFYVNTNPQSVNYVDDRKYTEAKSFGNIAALLSIAAILYGLLLFAYAGIFTASVLIDISFCGVFTGRDPRCN